MAKYPIKPKPWSKLKNRVETLWADDLDLAIHCTVYSFQTTHFRFDSPRHWIALGKTIIWDFPGPFMRPDPPRGKEIEHLDEHYGWNGQSSHVARTLRAYLDRPRDRLMEPFDDPWELADMLRAADRRLGRAQLAAWAATLDDQHPALPILAARKVLLTDTAVRQDMHHVS